MGKHRMKDDLENHSKDHNTVWSTDWISSEFYQRSNKSSSIWQENITKNLSWPYADRGRNLEKRYSGGRHGNGRFGKVRRIWFFIPEESTRQRSWSDKKMTSRFQIPICRWCKKTVRDYELREPTLQRNKPFGLKISVEDFMMNREKSLNRQKPQMTPNSCADFWSIQSDFIYRHHNEPRVQLYVPKEETFPILLKYIDGTWSTHTELDVLQEKRIDDYKNDDSGRYLSDSWWGLTKFIPCMERETSKRTDKDSNNYQTRSWKARNLDENW